VYPHLLSARSFFRDPVGYARARRNDRGIVHLRAGPSRYALIRAPDVIWRVDLRGATRLQRLLEAPFRGAMGNRAERVGRRVALARLRAHHGALDEEVPPDVWADFEAGRALRFHRGQVQEGTLERYAERRAEVASRFERLAREQAQAVE
jgi:hypothetical protein